MQQLSKLQQVSQLVNNMGWRYVAFRGTYELKKRTGILKRKFPVQPPAITPVPLKEWQSGKKPFFSLDRTKQINIDKAALAIQAQKILDGNILFFSSTWYNLGRDYDWVTNPDSGWKYDVNSHWSDINDFSSTAGDIKYVWEKSRFSFIHTLIRDDHWNKNDNAEFIFGEIESWIDHNPINCGPNYKCSQEISLRVLNWVWALYYYSEHASLTSQRWNKIINVIYWQMHHVYNNINFSRIAVRNNHAITETLALYIIGLLFPWFKNAAKWKQKGKEWFEKEIAYQVYEDGTFLQFSMNYHRVLIQLFSLGIGVADLNDEKFSDVVYERAYRSLNFLYQCQEDSNGMLPNYGANDGALFFPLNGCEYRDYRPQLNLLHQQLCRTQLYFGESAAWSEDVFWMQPKENSLRLKPLPSLKKMQGCLSFTAGGYYLIRDQGSFTFIRCGNHKDRPAHADNLHIDIWVNGENVLLDAGSYKYNTDAHTLKYFTGTASHNTVMIDDFDQMLKGSRFIWYNWTNCSTQPELKDAGEYFEFTGAIAAFRYLQNNIVHKRTVRKSKGQCQWQIHDELIAKPDGAAMRQLWHIKPDVHQKLTLDASDGEILQPTEMEGWYSGKYGMREPVKAMVFTINNSIIKTNITIDNS